MQALSIMALIIAIGVVSIQSILGAHAQPSPSNMTDIQNELKSELPTGSLQQATQPGDIIVTMICPRNFTAFDECQIFVGNPIQLNSTAQ